MMAGRAIKNSFCLKRLNEAARAMATVYRGAGRICRNIDIAFKKI